MHDILHSEWRIFMPTKVNIVLDDDVKMDLENLVKSGRRSRVINEALRRELQRIRRLDASNRLNRLRKKTEAVSNDEIVRLLRRDRGR
jgi:Arc/MetJ-type ribon-helix-helix transcriptional regulator